MKPLGEPPYDERYFAQVLALGEALDEALNGDAGPPRKVGFVLVLFPYAQDDACCNYISNGADGNDVARMLRAMISRLEGDFDVAGHA